jgi:uncharacterized protein (TIGR02271 family)
LGKDHEETLPLVEEHLQVDTRRATAGRVRIRTETKVEERTAVAEVFGEEIEVTRVPIDQEVNEPPRVRVDGDVTIVPVFEEILVVEKRLVLKEELHIRRRRTSEIVEIPVTLRRQHAVVDRLGPERDGDPFPTTQKE